MNFIFLGPPGCGKGTQADLLAKKLNLRHISSGVLLRAKASQDTPDAKLIKGFLDRGELVPFATIMRLVLDEIQSPVTPTSTPVIPGSTRNLPSPSVILSNQPVIPSNQTVIPSEVEGSLHSSVVTPESVGMTQNTGFILDGTPRNLDQAVALDEFFAENHITVDSVILFELSDEVTTERLLRRAQLEGRSDDNEATVQTRLGIYHQDTEPVIAHYKDQGKLIRIDAAPSIEDIFSTLLDQIPSR